MTALPMEDVAELAHDLDDSSLKIFSMYQNKDYLPNNQRVANMAWRIQNKKTLSRQHDRAARQTERRSLAEKDDSNFDYVALIRRISQEDYTREPAPVRSDEPRIVPSEFKDPEPEPSFLLLYIDLLELTLKNDFSKSSAAAGLLDAFSRPFAPPRRRTESALEARKVLQCTNCHTQTTPLWRKTSEGALLCNACGLFYKLHGILRPVNGVAQPKTAKHAPEMMSVAPTLSPAVAPTSVPATIAPTVAPTDIAPTSVAPASLVNFNPIYKGSPSTAVNTQPARRSWDVLSSNMDLFLSVDDPTTDHFSLFEKPLEKPSENDAFLRMEEEQEVDNWTWLDFAKVQ